jgi:adenosylcobinamide-GDP ribazoletransferase
VLDGLRLATGTFTVAPVRPPKAVDSGIARAAVIWAPAIGAVLGLGVGAIAQVAYATAHHRITVAALGSVLAIGALAWTTRALHLDGLADTADGLGSNRDAAGALAVMKRSDIGPFGVVTVVIVLLVQVTALTSAVVDGWALIAASTSIAAGRATVAWACARRIPAARSSGLGAAWAGSLPSWAAPLIAVVIAACAAGAAALWHPAGVSAGALAIRAAVAVLAAATVAIALLRRCVARFGGTTGDVMGAMIETGTAVALIAFALA